MGFFFLFIFAWVTSPFAKGGDSMSDAIIRHNCFGLPEDFDCDVCPENRGFRVGYAGVVGPCGQQNCWYSCRVCTYNGMDDCHDEEEEF